MTADELDEFLDDTTHVVCDAWEGKTGERMSEDEKYALNDLLTEFFKGKGPSAYEEFEDLV